MTSKLEQTLFGPGSDIIGFLGDDPEALGSLKVASGPMYNTITNLERLPKTPFNLGYLLSSSDPGIAFPALRRVSSSFDLPRCSVKKILLLRRNIIAKRSTTPVMPNHHYEQAELNRKTEYLLSLALNLKAEIDKDERQEILSAIISELQNIDSIDEQGPIALIANLDSIFDLISMIGIGNTKKEQESTLSLVRILYNIYAKLKIGENLEVGIDNFHNRVVELESMVVKLRFVPFGELSLGTKSLQKKILVMLLTSIESNMMGMIDNLIRQNTVDSLRAVIRTFDIYTWSAKQKIKLGYHTESRMEFVPEMLEQVPVEYSQEKSALLLRISKFLLDKANSIEESLKTSQLYVIGSRNPSQLFVQVKNLEMKVGRVTMGGSATKDKTHANIESTINIISDLYREPGLSEVLLIEIDGTPDEASKAILTDLLANIEKDADQYVKEQLSMLILDAPDEATKKIATDLLAKLL